MSTRLRKETLLDSREPGNSTQQITTSHPDFQEPSLLAVSVDTPLPRPKRRRRRAAADRGLPPDEELQHLALAYLERQSRHWPELAKRGLLREPTEIIIREMVDDFKHRHRSGKVDIEAVLPYKLAAKYLGGSYNRYSCDNSSPTSIVDQLVNALDKAKEEGRFVPWAYVFCDYSVTGLDSSRQGYSSYKAILSDELHFIETTYIDDFTRASRDELEWWKLAGISKRLRKRLIGASDGFDLHGGNGEIMVTIYGMLSRLFIKGLREKVMRGMRGAARRGTCLGKLALGFTRRVHRDSKGNEVTRADGRTRKEPCLDPATMEHRVLLYELFVLKGWSAYKIARHFNKLRVDGSDGWTGQTIKDLLRSPNAIGVFIWNRTRREYDWEEEKWLVVTNPRSEWEVFYDPQLAIVSMDLYRAARRKLAAMRAQSPLTGRKASRNQISALTLFSGTLVCQSCVDHKAGDAELKMVRSTSKYKQMGCPNGIIAAHECELSCSKSTKIIEESLLRYLDEEVLTEAALEKLVEKANLYLEEEAQKPVVDTTGMKAQARKLEGKINKLMNRIEKEDDDGLCDTYDQRIKEHQRDLNPLKQQIRDAERQNRKKEFKPLELSQAKSYLADLRGLLNQEISMAAAAIRTLTGPIMIRQEQIPGRKHGARWIATFRPNLSRLLQSVIKDKNCPELDGLGKACLAEQPAVEVIIDKVAQYERLAPKFKELHEKGASISTIAAAHGMSCQYAGEILRFSVTGERPKWKAGKRTGTGAKPTKYIEIREQVAYLRDCKKFTIPRIAKELGVSEGTVRRAYNLAHRDDLLEAAERGETLSPGRYSHLGEDVYEEIRNLLRNGMHVKEVASTVGCGKSTVVRVQRAMRESQAME